MGHQFVVAAGHQPPFVVKRLVKSFIYSITDCLLVSLKSTALQWLIANINSNHNLTRVEGALQWSTCIIDLGINLL